MSKYIVFDLEMCKIPSAERRRVFGCSTELIQIGAVMLDENYEIKDTFMTYVHPEYGFVDKFIEKLTGITRQDVENAPSAVSAIESFAEWIPEDAVPVSWSENDIKQLYAEIDGKNIRSDTLEDFLEKSIDCQQIFGEKMCAQRLYKLTEALNITAIDYDERIHDALVDARNTALLFKKVQTEEKLQLSPYLISDADIGFGVYYRSSGLLRRPVTA